MEYLFSHITTQAEYKYLVKVIDARDNSGDSVSLATTSELYSKAAFVRLDEMLSKYQGELASIWHAENKVFMYFVHFISLDYSLIVVRFVVVIGYSAPLPHLS